ncbi:MAG: aldo/keto reductase, partial [Verrucomicrobiaceae bacterium]|nr:aldo/keto reductase [Verrucomicrobiaceae bacterium]
MRRHPLHSTDLLVSSLGLGTVKFGRNEGVKYPTTFDLPTDEAILALLDLARAEGINLLDTAPAYGTSEERLGHLLGSRRDDWIIVSKAGEDFAEGRSHFDFSPTAITASVERTLLRLRTDRVESLLLHSDGNDLDVLDHSGAVETLFALKEQGKIRSAGISTKTVAGGLRAVALGLDVVMVTY